MAIRGKPPRGSENQNHWHTDKLKPGESFEGWLAGDAVCVQCHEAAFTKPCLKRYLGFDVPCPGCASRLKLCDIIFVPVYREIVLKKCVVPLRYAAAKRMESLPTHHCVVVTRPHGRNEGRFIEARKKQMAFPGGREHEMPADISDWLPSLWYYGDRLTGEHLLRGPIFDCPEASAPEATAKAMTEQEEIQLLRDAMAGKRVTRSSPAEAVGMGTVIDGMLGGVRVNQPADVEPKKPSKNGKH